MSAEGNGLEQARAAAQTLIESLNADESYKQTLRDDPVRALLEVGMPAGLMSTALQELGASDEEVQGYFGDFRVGADYKVAGPLRTPVSAAALPQLRQCLITAAYYSYVCF